MTHIMTKEVSFFPYPIGTFIDGWMDGLVQAESKATQQGRCLQKISIKPKARSMQRIKVWCKNCQFTESLERVNFQSLGTITYCAQRKKFKVGIHS